MVTNFNKVRQILNLWMILLLLAGHSVNYDNGHFTEDKSVAFKNFANMFAFAFWQTGNKDFQMKEQDIIFKNEKMKASRAICFLGFMFFSLLSYAQKEEIIEKIYQEELNNSHVYENLRYLCKNIGNRITGSPQAAKAVDYTKALMQRYQFDTVYLQSIRVPYWVRGKDPVIIMKTNTGGEVKLHSTALGNTIGTGANPIEGNVIELDSLGGLKILGKAGIAGKIVFFNRPLNQDYVDPRLAYDAAGDQRNNGPDEASKYGAIGVLVRSLAINTDYTPHTGYTFVDPKGKNIPAVAISTKDADILSKAIKANQNVRVSMQYSSGVQDTVTSYNVIGELRGSEFPNEIIVVGGHLDSWDVGEGAQDDGSGCMQTIEVGRIFKKLDIRPKRTIRIVMWMDEEIGFTGNIRYAQIAKEKNEKHIAALESDFGAGIPLGFRFDTDNDQLWKQINNWKSYFEPYNVFYFKKGYSGADIEPLAAPGTLRIGYQPDTNRYFKIHHTDNDVFEAVDKRELELGAAAITSLIYLIDQDGIQMK